MVTRSTAGLSATLITLVGARAVRGTTYGQKHAVEALARVSTGEIVTSIGASLATAED